MSRSSAIISFVSSSGFSQRASVSEVISLKKDRQGFVCFVFLFAIKQESSPEMPCCFSYH